MLGKFQESHLRIEVEAPAKVIADSLLKASNYHLWLPHQRFSTGMPENLTTGLQFTSWLGPVAIQHQVELIEDNSLQLLLSQGIDGYHQWRWGDGWIQSNLEGVSFLPLNLGQTVSLMSLRNFVENRAKSN